MLRLSDKNSQLIVSVIKVLLVFVILLLVLTKVLGFISPFLIALLITFIIEKPVRFLQKKVKLPRGTAVAIAMLVFVVVVGSLVGFLFYKLLMEVWNLTKDSTDFSNIVNQIKQLVESSSNWYANLPAEIVNAIQTNIDGVIERASKWLIDLVNGLLKTMLNIIQSLPQMLLYIIITLVSAYFISRDREKISEFIFRQLPHSWEEKTRSIKGDLLLAAVGYLKAIIILVAISFIEVLIGYRILGVKYALFLAIITALMDMLPIFGPGTVLIPGAAISLMSGDKITAIGFIVLYVIVTIVRQFLEPRIVGGNIGLHPLVTLIFIYLGFRLFGVTGIIFGPIFAIILKAFQKARILPQWKET